MKDEKSKGYPKILTHDDDFHVDEVFAIALLGLLGFGEKDLNDLVIQRSREKTMLDLYREKSGENYIIDIGLVYNEEDLHFDHHQSDPNLKWSEEEKLSDVNYKGRDFLYSSCGLIWKYLLKNENKFPEMKKLTQNQKDKIEFLVKWVDVCDNGISPWHLAPLIFTYNQATQGKSKEDVYIAFRNAICEAGVIIKNILNSSDASLKNMYIEDPKVSTSFYDRVLLELSAEKLKGLQEQEANVFELYVFSKYYKMMIVFMNACDLGDNRKVRKSISKLMDNFVEIAKKEVIANTKIKEALKEAKNEGRKDILMFVDDNYNARQLTSNMSEDGLLCATYYTEKDQWSITLINEKRDDPYTGKINMPKEWAGLTGDELAKVSGFNNIVFAHKGRFIVVMKGTKQECLDVCYRIIEISKKEF